MAAEAPNYCPIRVVNFALHLKCQIKIPQQSAAASCLLITHGETILQTNTFSAACRNLKLRLNPASITKKSQLILTIEFWEREAMFPLFPGSEIHGGHVGNGNIMTCGLGREYRASLEILPIVPGPVFTHKTYWMSAKNVRIENF